MGSRTCMKRNVISYEVDVVACTTSADAVMPRMCKFAVVHLTSYYNQQLTSTSCSAGTKDIGAKCWKSVRGFLPLAECSHMEVIRATNSAAP